jgi:hypothetical protein
MIMPTAASNRLAALAAMGLAATCGATGREKVYELTTEGRAAMEAVK